MECRLMEWVESRMMPTFLPGGICAAHGVIYSKEYIGEERVWGDSVGQGECGNL